MNTKNFRKTVYDTTEWVELRLEVLNKFEWTCQWCLHITEGELNTYTNEVHHICKIATHPELSFSLSNLIPICRKCHKNIDNNNSYQLVDGEFKSTQQILQKIVKEHHETIYKF